jgi:TusE/DsrC/DsvC family sulfur relay protein
MGYEYDGKTIESDDDGFLVDTAEWSEGLALAIAENDGLELTDKHWDVINYLRTEFFSNGSMQPMERAIKKAMEAHWQTKISSKELYNLFPQSPSKQGLKIAGLPPTTRKGGY